MAVFLRREPLKAWHDAISMCLHIVVADVKTAICCVRAILRGPPDVRPPRKLRRRRDGRTWHVRLAGIKRGL